MAAPPTHAKSVADTSRASCKGHRPDERGGQGDPGQIVDRTLVIAGSHPTELLEPADAALDGLITSDKFCWTRYVQLRLAWWRRPLRLRLDRQV
jgi:hypothetical protein